KNEWLHGYLEAILDVKAGNNGGRRFDPEMKRSSIRKKLEETDMKLLFSPTKYFVEEIVNTFEETDIHRTWIKVGVGRDIQHRDNRLENMCWRVWHIARKKKRIAWDLERRRYEREKGRRDAAEDLSELSEGEKDSNPVTAAAGLSRVNSDTQIWSEEDTPRNLYLVLISIHGLIRGENMELGRDPDTGGQVKYVVELARSLGDMAAVYRVDLITRQISSPEVSSTYGEPVEMLSSPSEDVISGGVYIVRIPCGPPNRYIPKESLWPYIGEFVDGALAHIVHVGKAIGEEINGGKPIRPYVVHGHYADAGEAASLLSGVLNVPMVLTGHSLGRNKLQQLLQQGSLTREDINSTYKIMRRIEAEEAALDAAAVVVTSTRQEVEEQWGLYDGFDVRLERKLRIRRRRGVSNFGRYMPRMVVIPPGIEFTNATAERKGSSDSDTDLKSLIDRRKSSIPPIWSEMMRFFKNPHKPMILALSRPDPKKNVVTLLKAFGESRILQELANMTLILGNRDNIEDMPESSSILLTTILKLVDKYNLYGQVAYPKHHKQNDVPEIYRLAAKTK
ncbi:sucrose-phosphate synthase 1, partial [Genlisea aurea]